MDSPSGLLAVLFLIRVDHNKVLQFLKTI